jgi:hypothetical protein
MEPAMSDAEAKALEFSAETRGGIIR